MKHNFQVISFTLLEAFFPLLQRKGELNLITTQNHLSSRHTTTRSKKTKTFKQLNKKGMLKDNYFFFLFIIIIMDVTQKKKKKKKSLLFIFDTPPCQCMSRNSNVK